MIAVSAVVLLWLASVTWSIVAAGRETASGSADAAIILGAAVQGTEPSPVFEQRLLHALELYRRGRVRSLILTGGVGKGKVVAESAAARVYLTNRGVPQSAMLSEDRSRTTRQNLVEARRLMRARGMAKALIVSDPLHMKRAMTMAADLGLAAEPSPTSTSRYRTPATQGPFLLREVYFLHHYWLFGQ